MTNVHRESHYIFQNLIKTCNTTSPSACCCTTTENDFSAGRFLLWNEVFQLTTTEKRFFSAPRRALRNPRDPGAERPWREATGREPVVSRPGLAVVNRVLNDQGAFYRKSALVRHYCRHQSGTYDRAGLREGLSVISDDARSGYCRVMHTEAGKNNL